MIPFESNYNFDAREVHYIINKHKFIELLCIKSDCGFQSTPEIITCLNEIQRCSKDKEEYEKFCVLLTLPSIDQHPDFQSWNPFSWRMNCFNQLLIHVQKLMQNPASTIDQYSTPHDLCIKDYSSNKYSNHHKKELNETEIQTDDFDGGSQSSLDENDADERNQTSESNQQQSTGDRLMQLIVKGILYENCVNYCEQIATSNSYNFNSTSTDHSHNDDKLMVEHHPIKLNQLDFSNLLNGDDTKTDLKLIHWLTSLPKESFNFFFDNSPPLDLRIEAFEKPSLVANWSEIILSTPIKPKVFPYDAIPFIKPLAPLSSINGTNHSSLNQSLTNHSNTNQTTPNQTQTHLNQLTTMNSNQTQQSQQMINQQLANLIVSLTSGGNTNSNFDNLDNLLNLVSQMNVLTNGFSQQQTQTQQTTTQSQQQKQINNSLNNNLNQSSSSIKNFYETILIDDLSNKSNLNLNGNIDRNVGLNDSNENGFPKLDFLAQNFSQLTSLNDLTNSVNNNIFNLTNGNTNLTNSNLNGNSGNHHTSTANLNSLLQSKSLQSLLNSNANLSDLNQALNGQLDEHTVTGQLDQTTASLQLNNQKLSAKVQKDFLKKMYHVQKKKLIEDNHHLMVCNNSSGNKLNHSYVTNQTGGLFGDDDLCKTGKRAKQHKKRDNPVSFFSVLFYFLFSVLLSDHY